MKTLIAIIIKFVGVCAAAWIAFMVFGTVAFWTVFIIACAVTVLNYLIGDLWILPKWGNIWASIIDGILAGVAAWSILYYAPITPAVYNFNNWVWIFAGIIAVAEFFFHMYLFNAHVVEKKRSDSALYKKNKLNYNTEHGGELFPYSRRMNMEANSDMLNNLNRGYDKDAKGYDKGASRFGDTDYDAGGSDTNTGGDWYSGDRHSGSADSGARYSGSGDFGGRGSGRRSGKNKLK